MPRPRRYTDDTVIDALNKAKGLVYMAARVIGCDPGMIHDRAKVSPPVRQCLANEAGDAETVGVPPVDRELGLFHFIGVAPETMTSRHQVFEIRAYLHRCATLQQASMMHYS
jgi:hypothetical protein